MGFGRNLVRVQATLDFGFTGTLLDRQYRLLCALRGRRRHRRSAPGSARCQEDGGEILLQIRQIDVASELMVGQEFDTGGEYASEFAAYDFARQSIIRDREQGAADFGDPVEHRGRRSDRAPVTAPRPG